MATQYATIVVRRGNAESWADSARPLEPGEWGYDDTSRVTKIGDGFSLWSELPIHLTASSDGELPQEVRARLAENLADPTTVEGAAVAAGGAGLTIDPESGLYLATSEWPIPSIDDESQLPAAVRDRLAANLSDPATPEGAAAGSIIGKPGPQGEPGPQGLPGVNALDNDASVAGYVVASSSATRAALDGLPGSFAAKPSDRDEDWVLAERDSKQRVHHAVGLDGRHIFPRGAQVSDGGTWLHDVQNTDYSWVAVRDANGRLGELRLDLAGRVPQDVLDAWSARMGTGTSGLPIDVLIVAGQSNATKRSSLPVTVSDVDPRVLQWNPAAGSMAVVPATDVQWIGNEFAREYVKNVPGRRLLIVPCAMGSTGFTTTSINPPPTGYTYTGNAAQGTWDRTLTSDPTNHYANMITSAKAAVAAAGSGARLIGALWSQGESDRGPLSQTQYAAKLDDLIGQARIDLGVANLPFIIGSMVPETIANNTTGTTAINLALLDTPRRVTRTAYVWGPAGMPEYGNGLIHWSPQGQAIRAREMARDGLYRARLNVAAANPVPPQGIKISRSGSAVHISWSAPPCRVTAYNIEISTDSGATWSTVTLADGPIATYCDTTAPTSAPVWVRGSTANTVGTSDTTLPEKA